MKTINSNVIAQLNTDISHIRMCLLFNLERVDSIEFQYSHQGDEYFFISAIAIGVSGYKHSHIHTVYYIVEA